jgi:hypothetical protein
MMMMVVEVSSTPATIIRHRADTVEVGFGLTRTKKALAYLSRLQPSLDFW